MKTHCGSAEYAAPELFRRDPHYGPSIDIWSFGSEYIFFILDLPALCIRIDNDKIT